MKLERNSRGASVLTVSGSLETSIDTLPDEKQVIVEGLASRAWKEARTTAHDAHLVQKILVASGTSVLAHAGGGGDLRGRHCVFLMVRVCVGDLIRIGMERDSVKTGNVAISCSVMIYMVPPSQLFSGQHSIIPRDGSYDVGIDRGRERCNALAQR
jgi:hypothetical protein